MRCNNNVWIWLFLDAAELVVELAVNDKMNTSIAHDELISLYRTLYSNIW